MKIHYYGKLDRLESCYSFQTFDINDVKVHIQNSTRFGYEPATMSIMNPAMFVEKNEAFYRYVIEDFQVKVENGFIVIDNGTLKNILESALQFL